ncbi:MAG TPA: hypothetical protein PLF54_11070 [Deltaproteobacteria bacterium]|nr:hypothetical protein [Deltaproteobacteria bacterium]HQJ09534.1 hypothetical protein [Deltaproteobacteria bacterium]
MNVSRKFLSRYERGAVKQNIYAFGAITASILALAAVVKVMAWVTKSLLAILVIFVAVSYVAVKTRGDRRFMSAPRPA